MIESGKPFAPLYYQGPTVGVFELRNRKSMLASAPADAIPYFLKAAKLDSDLKENPQLYLDLAAAYTTARAPSYPQTIKSIWTSRVAGSKLALANINQIIDAQIDALARAAALADAANKKTIMDALTVEYKDRNKSDAGLSDLVAKVLATPVPDIPKPLTSLPSTPSTSTPATGPSANGSAPNNTAPSNTTTGTNKAGNGASTTVPTKTGSAPVGGQQPQATASPTPKSRVQIIAADKNRTALVLGRQAETFLELLNFYAECIVTSTLHSRFAKISFREKFRVATAGRLEEILGYRFHNRTLLAQAMTHRSWAHEQVAPHAQHDARNLHNEALEFLGDSILGLIVAEYLFKAYPGASEGELSRMKHRW